MDIGSDQGSTTMAAAHRWFDAAAAASRTMDVGQSVPTGGQHGGVGDDVDMYFHPATAAAVAAVSDGPSGTSAAAAAAYYANPAAAAAARAAAVQSYRSPHHGPYTFLFLIYLYCLLSCDFKGVSEFHILSKTNC